MDQSYDPTDITDEDVRAFDEAERVRIAQIIERDDFRWLMADKRGRRFVARLLHRSGVKNPSYNTNALAMAHAEGRRSLGLWLDELALSLTPDRYLEMLNETSQ